ncbi:DUF6215 domain-containing protein [Streptomyces sp. SAS_267]|uniref:DUF6215 domain-containing protein n=1 Tax=Streptomyces sp. SAS_267 TaxID=3412750 RepID=UPI00403CB11C
MLGFLLRLLPFWVREPLLIVVGSVFGVRIMYLAVRDQELVPAGIGAAFLVFTAVRVHEVVRAWRARRSPGPAASANGAAIAVDVPAGTAADAPARMAADAPARSGAEPPRGPAAPRKDHNAWGQAVAAVALFGAVGAALWVVPRVMPSDVSAPHAIPCPPAEPEELSKVYKKTPRPVTGQELCKTLNRPGVAKLLGTPAGETATSVSATNNTAPLTGGRVAQPEAEVRFGTYTVNVAATYNDLSTAQYVKLMKYGTEQNIKTLTVLGRPAVFSSDHTMQFRISAGSGGTGGPVEQGPLARTLTVALDHKDRGGYCDITVWSESGALPDDSVLLAVAGKILPKIPERADR